MHLPPVDQYRADFVVPIGHLAMQAAYADDNLISLCARIPFDGSEHQLPPQDVAHKLRNLSPQAKEFISQRLGLIVDKDVRDQATETVDRLFALRDKRHRAVHDAIAIGIFGDNGKYEAKPLSVEYRREAGSTSVILTQISPDQIAALACEMYEVQKDLEFLAQQLQPSSELNTKSP